MTEAEWLTGDDPLAMCRCLRRSGWLSDRKARLLVVAYCRRNWGKFPDDVARRAVEVAERFADGLADAAGLRAARAAVEPARPSRGRRWAEAAWAAASDPPLVYTPHGTVPLVRDIFVNPFLPVTLDPAWLTPTVTALARGMYDSRDFSPMPILADALQDAGCEADDVLAHCRGPGPHVRGCWVVDLVLGKG